MADIETIENNTKQSFSKVKEEMELLKQVSRQHSQLIEELIENQNALMSRIKDIEKKNTDLKPKKP